MDVQITPKPLRGSVAAPSSKSHAHRLVLCAALADKPTTIYWNQVSNDILAMLSCVQALGAAYTLRDDGAEITPIQGRAGQVELRCRESGNTLRFLLPVAAALTDSAVCYGAGRLGQRPLEPLLSALNAHGSDAVLANLDAAATDGTAEYPIVTVSGRLTGGAYTLPGDVSSQFISGLLFALPLLAGDSEIHVTPPFESSAYVDMTVEALAAFGVAAGRPDGYTFVIKGGQRYVSPRSVTAQGDWSNAAFWLAANALGGAVTCEGLSAQSVQGDKAIIELLQLFRQPGGTVTVDAGQTPDLVPILAVVAANTPGKTVFTNAGRLRDKESDRLRAVAVNLAALGVEAREQGDELAVFGRERLDGGTVDSFNDHRIAMAFAVAGTVCRGPVTLRGADAVNKTYPGFFDDFARLGGIVHVI